MKTPLYIGFFLVNNIPTYIIKKCNSLILCVLFLEVPGNTMLRSENELKVDGPWIRRGGAIGIRLGVIFLGEKRLEEIQYLFFLDYPDLKAQKRLFITKLCNS